eukprot:TRINITY_DN19007_c0_g1_i1.p1 TRINITY_DN19007_c0_g1~~TRINITY_DN19007_c0_g1_i1.p1  ORF type:complete len:465 (+),score=136.32 TRINITY_DN19007_c0_g1_i1:167-1561(+)
MPESAGSSPVMGGSSKHEDQQLQQPLLDADGDASPPTPTAHQGAAAAVQEHDGVSSAGRASTLAQDTPVGATAALLPPIQPPEEVQRQSARPRPGSLVMQSGCGEAVEPLDQPEPGSPYHGTVRQMKSILLEIQGGIDAGALPELVEAGSSGSYWIKSAVRKTLGIFKPKSEEPYGPANPKWGKFFQRVCCPCCFGRSCLLPNTGYLSEAGAFAVDCALDLRVVPPTQIIQLRAPSFNYNKMQRAMRRLPLKIGSFQVFVRSEGTGACVKWEELDAASRESFLEQFQRLVVLDYMIRNTDRGLDNWLVKCDKVPAEGGALVDKWKIHAIDNGLAFPFKHPDNWRIYPPSWASHQLGRVPFLPQVREHVLRKISNPGFMTKLESRLREIFRHDSGFSENRFQGQIAVMRGQRQNLFDLLNRPVESERTPEALFAMHPLFIVKQQTEEGKHQLVGWETHLPCFTCC